MAKILIAEDDDGVRQFVARALTHAGHEITEAADGGLAAEILQEQQGAFDLLLSDIKMPVMDGIALALNVAAAWPDITIVLMTGLPSSASATFCIRSASVNGFGITS